MRQALAVFACGGLLVTGCGGDDADDEPGAAEAVETTTTTTETTTPATVADDSVEPAEVDVAVPGGPDGEFAFDTTLTSIEAGPVEVRLANGGALEHQAAIFRFKDGETFDTFFAAAATEGPDAALALVDGYGGPNAVAPGATGSSTQVLVPGEYALLCVIPDANGVPHAASGMLKPFTVTEPAGSAEPAEPVAAIELPAADVEADMLDLAFSVPASLPAGATVRATNRGEQVHEMVAYRLTDGQDVEDVISSAVAAGGAPPVLPPAGGIGLVAPGGTAEFRLPEVPGDYVFLCFVPDSTTEGGPPHFVRGMASQVRVE